MLNMQMAAPADVGQSAASFGSRSPFEGYSRTLTPEGGILIHYQDLNLGWPLKSLRIACCLGITALGGWLVLQAEDFLSASAIGTVAVTAAIDWVFLKYKIRARHSVEVRQDCMIIDGNDVFFAEDIGDNYPELVALPNAPDQKRIAGICGTRYVEYLTANAVNERDKTPEVLAAHLKEAIEQLWARREVTFPGSY